MKGGRRSFSGTGGRWRVDGGGGRVYGMGDDLFGGGQESLNHLFAVGFIEWSEFPEMLAVP